MDVLSDLALGAATAFTLDDLLYCFTGTLLGTLIGVLPGLRPAATVAMLLPMTATIPPDTALIMLAGIYYGAQYGGSTTAILVNVPARPRPRSPRSTATMARDGRAGTALAIAAIGSFCAGTIATFVVALLAVPLSRFAILFGSPDTSR